MAEEKKFGLLRGLSDIMIAEVTEDTAENYTVGVPQQLIPAGEMTTTTEIERTAKYFDNAVFEEVQREAPSEIQLIGAAIRAAWQAYLAGKDVDTASGVVIDDGDPHTKYYHISGKKKYTDGTELYFAFMKVTLTIPEEADKTEDDTTDANGTTMNMTAYKTIHKFEKTKKACKLMKLESTSGNVEDIAAWLTTAMTPDTITGTVKAN